jgi:hypothetical protein
MVHTARQPKKAYVRTGTYWVTTLQRHRATLMKMSTQDQFGEEDERRRKASRSSD